MKTFEAATLEQWRKWLARHHENAAEVWLVFHKQHTGRACIAYEDAVNEALCFGWIDSLIKRLDAARYARKFTPRTPESRWSALNRMRYARLKAEGRLMPAGLRRAPTDRTYDAPPPRLARVPPYVEEAFQKNPTAWSNFERLPPSQRRRYAAWIDSAKQEATKARRVQEAIRLLAMGRKLGLK